MDWIYLVGLIIIGLLALFFIPRWFTKRAIRQVVNIFLKNNVVNPETARTLDELKLAPQSYLRRMGSLRDYKPVALDLLVQNGVIIIKNDKYYLSEEKLANSPIRTWAKIPPRRF